MLTLCVIFRVHNKVNAHSEELLPFFTKTLPSLSLETRKQIPSEELGLPPEDVSAKSPEFLIQN